MIIDIHDVGHGACAVITCPNGEIIMIDCGFRGGDFWFPSIEYFGRTIAALIFQNLDEDHLDDLPDLCKYCNIESIITNPTVKAAALAQMKTDGMRSGIKHAHSILNRFGTGRIGPLANGGGVSSWSYYNRYYWDFEDTNNLSLATFVRYGEFTVLFGGDLETPGWKVLLQNPRFLHDLSSVKVFVASHHGRKNGQCEELFYVCRPDLIIFSDDSKKHGTQETSDWYGSRASGIPILDAAPHPILGLPRRYVMTTRNDGSIKIPASYSGRYRVITSGSEFFSKLQYPTPQIALA